MADNFDFKDASGTTLKARAKETAAGVFSSFVHLMTGGTEIDPANPLPVRGLIVNASASLTLPSGTPTYTIGDLIANSASGASVVPLEFTLARNAGGQFFVTRGRITSSRTASTSSGFFRLHLYTSAPAVASGGATGDDGVFATNVSGSANYVGAIDFTLDRQHADGYAGAGTPPVGGAIAVDLASGQKLYGLLEARAAYTRISIEVLGFTLEGFQY